VAFFGDLVHGPRRTPSYLLFANRADQRFRRQFPQLRIQGSAGYPAPYLGVGQFAGPADLVTVHRSALS
jgi:hypothetical protein